MTQREEFEAWARDYLFNHDIKDEAWEAWQAAQAAQPAHAHAIDTSPGWMTIDSAPKDGTRVLIKADCTVVAGWQNVFDDTFGWVVINDVWVPEHMATHWQPLPAAPSTKEQS
jgi:hypothetical protein